MNKNAGIGQGEAFAFVSGQKKEGAHAGSLADAIGDDVVLDELHGVIDGETGGNGAPRGVDVERDVLLGILALEEEHLGDDKIRDLVVDGSTKKDNVVAQQTGVDVVGALAPTRLLNHHGNQCHS